MYTSYLMENVDLILFVLVHQINANPHGAKKDYIFLYGGNDIEWVRQLKKEIENLRLLDIEPRMVYVGRNREVRSSNAPSDCLDDLSAWLFWTRLKSMFLSRMHYLSKASVIKKDDDKIIKGLKKLLAYKALGEIGGWCLVCTKDMVILCENEPKMLEFSYKKDQKEFVENNICLHHSPCCELEYPSELEYPTTFTEIPESEKCPDCDTDMYKLITFMCFHDHDNNDLEEKEEDDATNK